MLRFLLLADPFGPATNAPDQSGTYGIEHQSSLPNQQSIGWMNTVSEQRGYRDNAAGVAAALSWRDGCGCE